jgi:hypothetical protein
MKRFPSLSSSIDAKISISVYVTLYLICIKFVKSALRHKRAEDRLPVRRERTHLMVRLFEEREQLTEEATIHTCEAEKFLGVILDVT